MKSYNTYGLFLYSVDPRQYLSVFHSGINSGSQILFEDYGLPDSRFLQCMNFNNAIQDLETDITPLTLAIVKLDMYPAC